MPRSGYSALHGVNPNLKKPINESKIHERIKSILIHKYQHKST